MTLFDNAVKKKIIVDSKKTFTPNRFSSRNIHSGLFPSFRDDLESLIYLLVYFLLEGDFLNQSSMEEVKVFKLGFVIETLYPRVPEELIVVFNYVSKTGFDEPLSMSFVTNVMMKYFLRADIDPSRVQYDWVTRFQEEDERESEVAERTVEEEGTERDSVAL